MPTRTARAQQTEKVENHRSITDNKIVTTPFADTMPRRRLSPKE